MQAFLSGFAELITAFFVKAKRQGFSIILLIVISCGLLYRSTYVEDQCEERVERIEAKMERVNAEYAAALNEARREFRECDQKRQDLAVLVAELKTVVKKNQKR